MSSHETVLCFSLRFIVTPMDKIPAETEEEEGISSGRWKDLILLFFFCNDESLLDLHRKITSANVSSPFCLIQVTKCSI